MANLSIPSIRERLFNTSRHEQSTQRSNSTNPFAATSFKGNVLTADVFESSNKINNDQPSFTGKLKASALVGSISDLGSKINKCWESVKNFGNRMKNVLTQEIEISFNPAKEKAVSMYNSMKEALTTSYSISDLIPTGGISAKSVAKMEDMTAAKALLSDNVALWEAAA